MNKATGTRAGGSHAAGAHSQPRGGSGVQASSVSVTFGNGVVFVFSRQPPTEQLWLATPGGGFHYQWDDVQEMWRDTKTDESFHQVLVSELAQHVGLTLDW